MYVCLHRYITKTQNPTPVLYFSFTALMAAISANKKKGTKAQKSPPKRKQKSELFTPKRSKKEESSDLFDASDEEVIEEHDEEFDGDENEDGSDSGSGSGSDVSSDGDNPFGDDFLQGSDDEGEGAEKGDSGSSFGSDSDSDSDVSDIEAKSREIDLERKRVEQEAMDEMQLNIKDESDEFRLPTKEVIVCSTFSFFSIKLLEFYGNMVL